MPHHQVNIDEVFRQLLDEDLTKYAESSWEDMYVLLGQFMPTGEYPKEAPETLYNIVTHV